ncbi:hypothetical protein F5Y04DRAFT_293517 [Hypomontagnella monticulosa]|nr:hypothetical protein F5Y04DRAFT_293517 [Hypomontagnella monticulosa]
MDYIQDISPSGDLPYPNLIQAYANSDQHMYFMEPKQPSVRGGAGKLLQDATECDFEKSVSKNFGTFGSFTHVYTKPRLGAGSHYFTFYRKDPGTLDYGLGRLNEDVYECAKMNIMRHPLPDDPNNPDYAVAMAPSDAVQGMNKALLRLTNYPFIPNPVMSAPLLPRRGPTGGPDDVRGVSSDGRFSKPASQQPQGLSKVFQIPELCMKLMLELGNRWGDLSNLSRSCQMMMFAINKVSTRVDLTRGDFMNMDFEDGEIDLAMACAANKDRCVNGKFQKPGSVAFLIMSNVRNIHKIPGEDKTNNAGRQTGWYKPSAERRIIDTYKMLKSFHIRGRHMKILHLHSVPNFDVPLLEKCLEHLPNLEVLGIHNCELLHFGCTIPLLRAIIEHNNKDENKIVRADFSPRYYFGMDVNSDGRTGEYGVIPSDQGTIDTRRAIVAVLRTAVPLALDNNIDWFTPGTGMRQFLERIPFKLGTLRYILEALYRIHDYESGVHYRLSNKTIPPQEVNDYFSSDTLRRTIYNDLVLAVEGTAMERDMLFPLTTIRDQFHLVQCAYCAAKLPAYFYTEESANRQASQVQCAGCQLCIQLELQVDNFFEEKKGVMSHLFNHGRIKTIDEFLTATRTATDEEIENFHFPFWDLAVKTKNQVRGPVRQALQDPDFSVLDDRPGPKKPEEDKQIWIWRERTMLAMRHAACKIDRGHEKAERRIANCRRAIEYLNYLYSAGNPSDFAQVRENRDTVEKLERFIIQERARCGEAQMIGKYGTVAAANWDTEIKKYRETVQKNAGLIQNNGPRVIWGDEKTSLFW